MKRKELKKELFEFITMIKRRDFCLNPELKELAKDLTEKSMSIVPSGDPTQYYQALKYINNIFPMGNNLKEAI